MRALLLSLLCLALLSYGAVRLLPPEWQPWAPLDVAAPATPVTWFKLRLATGDAALCQAALRTAPLTVQPVPASPAGAACPLADAVRVSAAPGGPRFAPGSFLANCPLALDWAMFLSHAVQPAAQQAFGRPVVQIDHLGSYACRDVAGTDRPSAHARAEALDVARFHIAGGPAVPVTAWHDGGADGAFLHELRDGACRFFGITLSPDYNAAHAGHFHLQASGWGLCR